jgi:hypothetical protein
MLQVVKRIETQQDFDVRKSEVGIKHGDTRTALRERNRKVYACVRFANPAFAAGHREDAPGALVLPHKITQVVRLSRHVTAHFPEG